jgi:E3 ubiquitin-protein ligase UBR4
LVGFRIHVGNTSPNHIPSSISICDRIIPLEIGLKRWYDIPLTRVESLLSDKEFTFTIASTFNSTSNPRIDSLEVYALSKDDFKWKEKLNAALATDSSDDAAVKKHGDESKNTTEENEQSIERILSNCFSTLHLLYALCSSQSSVLLTPNEFEDEKGKKKDADSLFTLDMFDLLFGLFQSSCGLGLKASARGLLSVLFPSKIAYYQVQYRLHFDFCNMRFLISMCMRAFMCILTTTLDLTLT